LTTILLIVVETSGVFIYHFPIATHQFIRGLEPQFTILVRILGAKVAGGRNFQA
jgi:hypothetical protein